MKKAKRFALAFAALALLAAVLFCPAAGAANLDEIEKYFITVRLQPDGSAEIDYDIHWKVLDSTTAGPLEWVKIGVPNNNIEPVSHSDTIAALYPYQEGGSYVRLDLDRSYYAGETVRLEFTLHVTHLYELYDDGSVNFEFTPGWFDEAETRRLSLTWKDGAGNASYAASLDGVPVTGDLVDVEGGVQGVWTDLPRAARLTFTADYADQSAFAAAPLDATMDRNSADTGGWEMGDIVVQQISVDVDALMTMVLVTIVILWIILRRASGNYFLGGFGGWFWPHHHGGPRPPHGGGGGGASGGFGGFGGGSSRGSGAGRRSGGGCACACACVSCACACACAGGGRAGCSAKDFKGAVNAAALHAILEQNKEE